MLDFVAHLSCLPIMCTLYKLDCASRKMNKESNHVQQFLYVMRYGEQKKHANNLAQTLSQTRIMSLQVVKLHQKLGKPIPEPTPIKPPEPKEGMKENGDKKPGNGNKGPMRKPPPKKMAAPKITFVGGTKLTSTGLIKTDTGPSGAASGNLTTGSAAAQDVDMDDGKIH